MNLYYNSILLISIDSECYNHLILVDLYNISPFKDLVSEDSTMYRGSVFAYSQNCMQFSINLEMQSHSNQNVYRMLKNRMRQVNFQVV